MSTVKTKNVQIGADGTASNNFTIYQPSTPDGTSRWAVGVSGATTADVVTVNSSGNVGIGTTSPNNRLIVNGAVGVSGEAAAAISNGCLIDQTAGFLTRILNYSSTIGSAIALYTGSTGTSTERMRIDSSGNVLVGKTGTGFSTNGIELRADNELWVTKDSSIPMSLNRKTTTGELTRFHYNGTKVGDISTNGTGTTYNSSSDYRLKENIQPMIGALDKVAQLKPVTYTWKADGSNGQGFIAHELQEVVPDCVTGEKDAVNEDGSINPQGIDTSKLVATLTAAIQELTKRVQELEAKVN